MCNVLYNRKIRAGFYKEVLHILQSEEELELEVGDMRDLPSMSTFTFRGVRKGTVGANRQ